jgi:DNA-binding NarL/FixJ family response regulator
MSQGTNRQICTELAISLSTVETHVSRIMTKLHVATRVEAVLYAIKHVLVAGPI